MKMSKWKMDRWVFCLTIQGLWEGKGEKAGEGFDTFLPKPSLEDIHIHQTSPSGFITQTQNKYSPPPLCCGGQ